MQRDYKHNYRLDFRDGSFYYGIKNREVKWGLNDPYLSLIFELDHFVEVTDKAKIMWSLLNE